MKKISPTILATALHEALVSSPAKEHKAIIKRFVEFVQKKKMMSKDKSIVELYEKISRASEGIAEGEVTTASALSATLKKQVEKFIQKEFNVKEVYLKETISKDILGGIKIKMGDTVIDGTLQGRLKQLQATLSN